jgi:hypothetical protein
VQHAPTIFLSHLWTPLGDCLKMSRSLLTWSTNSAMLGGLSAFICEVEGHIFFVLKKDLGEIPGQSP